MIERKIKGTGRKKHFRSNGCNYWRLEATTISEILHLFGQGNLTFIRQKSGDFEN